MGGSDVTNMADADAKAGRHASNKGRLAREPPFGSSVPALRSLDETAGFDTVRAVSLAGVDLHRQGHKSAQGRVGEPALRWNAYFSSQSPRYLPLYLADISCSPIVIFIEPS